MLFTYFSIIHLQILVSWHRARRHQPGGRATAPRATRPCRLARAGYRRRCPWAAALRRAGTFSRSPAAAQRPFSSTFRPKPPAPGSPGLRVLNKDTTNSIFFFFFPFLFIFSLLEIWKTLKNNISINTNLNIILTERINNYVDINSAQKYKIMRMNSLYF